MRQNLFRAPDTIIGRCDRLGRHRRKRRDRPYVSGPCKHWIKVKNPDAPWKIDSLKSNEHDREVGSVANDISPPRPSIADRIRRDGRRQELGVTAALRTVMQMSEIHKPARS